MSLRPVLDLTKTHFRHQHGDITVIGTWIFQDNQPRPCLVLVPTYGGEGHERTTPCVVTVDTAYIWSEDPHVGDPVHVARQSVAFAKAMGLDYLSAITCMRIAAAVRDHIGDLLRIPPRPGHDRRVVADAIITHADGKQVHKEITDVR